MGKMTIEIAAAATPAIVEVSSTNTSCSTEKTITVKFNGSNKHVSITSAGDGVFGQSFSGVITADTNFTIYVDGSISPNTSQNTFSGTVTLTVREGSSTGEVLIRTSIGRTHSNNYC